ncbi:PIG-L family deacetylase [Paraburkholderia sp.]|uniref:PIG-L family deacetylase n=1 Tax=Paraburkholderia sp. TaxID=1926495 RepID=UPI003C73D558
MSSSISTLILSPHCDDAPLSLGAALLDGVFGERPRVAVVFSRSRYTKTQPCTGEEPEVTRLRNAEERAAADRADYDVEFWGYGEPFVRPGFNPDCTSDSQLFDVTRSIEGDVAWRAVSSAVEDALSRHEGLLMVPLGCGNHIDHRIVHHAVLQCYAKYPRIWVGFYEDLPYCNHICDEDILSHVPNLNDRKLSSRLVQLGIDSKISLLRIYRSQFWRFDLDKVHAYWNRRSGERFWVEEAVPLCNDSRQSLPTG